MAKINHELRERFCLEYVKDFRGGPAARRAGIENRATSRSWASRALDEPEVIARIEELKQARAKRIIMDGDAVMRKLDLIANADLHELVQFRRGACRHCYGTDFGYQRTDGEFRAARARHAKEAKAADASGLTLAEPYPEFDPQGGPGYNSQKDPNEDCPECFGDGIGVPFYQDTRELSETARAAYAGVETTKDGFKVKFHDPMKALELMGKHHGVLSEKVDVNLTGNLAERILNGRKRS